MPLASAGASPSTTSYVGKDWTPLQHAPLLSKPVAGLKEAERLLSGTQIWLSAISCCPGAMIIWMLWVHSGQGGKEGEVSDQKAWQTRLVPLKQDQINLM